MENRAAPRRCGRWIALAAPVLTVLVLLASASWLAGSDAGLRATCAFIEQLAGGALNLEEPAGTLAESFSLRSARWRSETLAIDVHDLQVDWQPSELLRGHLAVSRLLATSLRVAYVSTSEQVVLPDSLRLPLAIDVAQLRLGRIEVGDYAHPDGKAATLAEALNAKVSSDGEVHRVLELQVRIAGLAVVGEAVLGADKPFALTSKAGIEGEAVGRQLAFGLAADGRLEDFSLVGSAWPLAVAVDSKSAGQKVAGKESAGDKFAGDLSAKISPFAPQPIVEAVVKLTGINPAAWVSGAPQAQIDVRADLQALPAAASGLGGRITVVNRRAGSLDRNLIPIEYLTAALRLHETALDLADLDLRVAGGGRLQGSGTLRAEELALRVAVTALDASALYGSLQRTQLAGTLRANLGLHSQSLEMDLRAAGNAHNAPFATAGKLTIDPVAVSIEALRLAAGDAQLTLGGKVALVDVGKFELRGKLTHFDPSRFAKAPAANLDADFDAQGTSRGALSLGLHFQLRDSHFGRESLAGGGEVDFANDRLKKTNVELTAAGNHLSAKGAFGAPGDRLTVSIAAPRLDPLGVMGDINGTVVLGGSVKAPEVSADVRSTRLAVPALGQIHGLDLVARLGDGRDGILSGKLRIARFERPDGESLVDDVTLDAEGLRSRHRLRGHLTIAGKRDLYLLLEGGFIAAAKAAPAAGVAWAGTLSKLTLASHIDKERSSLHGPAPTSPIDRPFLRLTTPTPLKASAGSFSAGPAQFAGPGWSLQVDRVHYEQQHWQTAGSVHGLPVPETLAEFPELFATLPVKGNGEPLRVNAKWDVNGNSGGSSASATAPAYSALPGAHLHVWRESGDLLIGALPLGLEDAALTLRASAGRLESQIALRGKRLGEIKGDLFAAAAADSLIDRNAPWHGQLQVYSPDLSWAGPLIADGWQLGGRLSGAMQIRGTPAQPRVNGEWQGEQLVVRVLDLGMRLEHGKLFAQLAGENAADLRLILKELSFDSVLQPMPRALLLKEGIDSVSLTDKPGRVEASGELHAGQANGFLTLKANRLGVLQRSDQWVLVSGEGKLTLGERILDIVGSFKIDAAWWELAKNDAPQLSDDVVIKRAGQAKPPAAALLLSVNLAADLGRNFYFHGAGVDSRLVGELKIRSEGTGLPRATGTIRTRDGRFDAYGQKLDIERGILNFQGPIDNPGLNIRALRRNLPIEAGVEVTSTAKRPLVKLVSDPAVPDAEKLSWLVLGHGPEQGKDSSVLLAAAQTILGGQDGGPLKAIQHSLGIDEFGVTSGKLDGSGRWQTSRIASTTGFGSTDTTTGQIVSVGKRLASNVVLSYEQSLSATGSVVKLTVDLSRNFSLVGRAGTDTGFDLLWNHRFGR